MSLDTIVGQAGLEFLKIYYKIYFFFLFFVITTPNLKLYKE